MESRCPGQDGRGLSAGITRCSECGYGVEMFSDETRRKCPGCKAVVYRRQMPSCIDWCRYAEKCVGEGFLNRYRREKALLTKEKLLEEIEASAEGDPARKAHTRKVLSAAEKLLEEEKADFHIVLPAVILHDAGERREMCAEEAKNIMLRQGFRKEDMDEICGIISSHHSPGKLPEGINAKVLHDAHKLASIKESIEEGKGNACPRGFAEESFLTGTGRALAREHMEGKNS